MPCQLCFSFDNEEFTCLSLIDGYYYSGDIIEFQTTADSQLIFFYFTLEEDTSNVFSFYVPECIVGIDERPTSLISVYPNPAKDHILLNDSKNLLHFDIKLFDSLGSEVLREKELNSTIDVSNLANGIYYLSIVKEGKTIQTEKIIISK